VDAVANEDATDGVLVGVGAKLPRTGCAVVDGSQVEQQAAGLMRDQCCWNRRGAHGVEKQNGGMQRPSARDWGRRPGEITLNLDNSEEDRAAAGRLQREEDARLGRGYVD
jgi:hypothetical protein